MINKIFELASKFIVRILDPAGKLSFGRFMTIPIVGCVLSWDSAYVCLSWKMNFAHPELHLAMIDMLPSVAMMIGQATFMTVFYGVTKFQEYKMNAVAGEPIQGVAPAA